MAAAELLSTNTGAANSSDQVLTSGTTVSLKGQGPGAVVNLYLKDDAGGYNYIGQLTSEAPAKTLGGGGTYRFTRLAISTICGVFSG